MDDAEFYQNLDYTQYYASDKIYRLFCNYYWLQLLAQAIIVGFLIYILITHQENLHHFSDPYSQFNDLTFMCVSMGTWTIEIIANLYFNIIVTATFRWLSFDSKNKVLLFLSLFNMSLQMIVLDIITSNYLLVDRNIIDNTVNIALLAVAWCQTTKVAMFIFMGVIWHILNMLPHFDWGQRCILFILGHPVENKLKQHLIKEIPPELECSICLNQLDDNFQSKPNPPNVVILNCGHLFHRDCILQWLNITQKCPMCKMPFDITNESTPLLDMF